MIPFKKVTIAGAIAASIMNVTIAQAHVSYNTNPSLRNGNAGGENIWTAGTPSYTGNLPATWLANVHNTGQTYMVSTAHADTVYAPDEDGLQPEYVIESYNNKWNPSHSWGNALDYGLINLDFAGDLTVKVEADSSLASTFEAGFTLWSGWDEGTGNRHGPWNADPLAPGDRRATGLSYLGHASTTSSDGGSNYSSADGAVEITFEDLAAGQYSLWIGGNGTNDLGGKTSIGQQYKASISAVPVPAAVWLFGSALAGLVGVNRRKTTAA